jgi:hypothetical protein
MKKATKGKALIHPSFPSQGTPQPAHLGSAQMPTSNALSPLSNQLIGPSPLNLPTDQGSPTQAYTEE